jgi:hypothetical protein
MLESDKMATIGVTYSRDGLTYLRGGLTYSRDGLTYSRDEATYSRDGLTYLRGGVTYSRDGATYLRGGVTYSRDGMTYLVAIIAQQPSKTLIESKDMTDYITLFPYLIIRNKVIRFDSPLFRFLLRLNKFPNLY